MLLAYTTNSLIMNVTAFSNEIGLYVVLSDNNTIVEGNFSRNAWDGIQSISSSNNTILRNVVDGNMQAGVRLSHSYDILFLYSENNTLVSNHAGYNNDGLYLEKSSFNVVSDNLLIGNERSGIALDESSGNLLSENVLANNAYGVWSIASRDKLYHNNFVNNTVQSGSPPFSASSANSWDDGYPSGGNFWSNNNSTDSYMCEHQNITGSDGICDTVYAIDANNTDHYPLMGKFYSFEATPEYPIQFVCNSSISDLRFNGTAIAFKVTSLNATVGFCRVSIPKPLFNQSYAVFVDGTEIAYSLLPCTNTSNDYLYILFEGSTERVVIIQEYPTLIVLFLLSSTGALAFVVARKKRCHLSKDRKLQRISEANRMGRP
jgi:parallel beta-helix repeat protein